MKSRESLCASQMIWQIIISVKVKLYVQDSFRDDYGISYVTINYGTDFVQPYITWYNYRKYSQLKVSQLSILFNEKNSIYAKMLFKML